NLGEPVWRNLSATMTSLSSVAAVLGAGPVNTSNGRDAERVQAARVSRNLFSTLGVAPALGRSFSPEEATENGPIAIVISDSLWERFFNRSADVLSKTLSVEGVGVPIVGVMPAGFSYPAGTDVWATFERNGSYGGATAHNFEVIGRLAPGKTLVAAQTELDLVKSRLFAADPDMAKEGYGLRVADLRGDLLATSSTAVLTLFA